MSEDILRRVPPQNIEAEESVLGAILLENDAVNAVLEVAGVEDFYRESHRLIFQAMVEMADRNQPVDAVTLTDCLRSKGVLEQVGGPAYIAELAMRVPTAANTAYYAKIVREKSVQRQLVAFGTRTAAAMFDAPPHWSPDWTAEQLAVFEYELAQIISRGERKPQATKAETLGSVLWQLEHGSTRGLGIGLKSVDSVFGGFLPGHLSILAARTSRGKSALAMQIAIKVAMAKHPSVFFTLKQNEPEMWTRAVGHRALLDTFVPSDGPPPCFTAEQRALFKQQCDLLTKLPFDILYRPSLQPRQLRLECRRLAREMGELRLVIVDYLGLMRGDRPERERWREMQEVVLALKALAGELGTAILLLCQLNREGNDMMPPSLANLRDTGATEEHASNVFFLWSPPSTKERPCAPDTELIIAKQRNGPSHLTIPLHFAKPYGLFSEQR